MPNSQGGGEAAFRGLDYQKKIIAYLSLGMLSKEPPIRNSVACEHLDDIEVEEDSKLIYYQVKSTTESSLPKSKIIDSIKLFSSIESNKNEEKFNEYILISNAKIRKFNNNLVKHSFDSLDNVIKDEIKSLEEVKTKNELLKRVYFMKGPPLEEISSLIVTSLVHTFKGDENYSYDYINIQKELLSHINRMCPGPIDLEDKKIIYESEKEQYHLKHKTITPDIINMIIETNRKSSTKPTRRVTQSLTIKYNIMPSHLSGEEAKTIHDLINEYNSFSEDDELRHTYILKFNELSSRLNLYRDQIFLDFLKEQFRSCKNKHIILECSFILHNLIIASKAENESSFLKYATKVYFPLFKENLESGNGIYEYSFFKIEQVIEELKDFISKEEICEMYWKRMVNIIRKIKESGITDNTLWNCITKLNQCRINTEWRKWLIKKDEFSDIKNAVFRELSSSKLI